ncbi:hypothetical protein AC520_1323 [Enterobacter sp. OLF]|nr:hypothetical protein AC520_1323 [Enterobacter sp. OLF]
MQKRPLRHGRGKKMCQRSRSKKDARMNIALWREIERGM